MLLIKECCGTKKEPCGELLGFHLGAQENGVSHGLCRKHHLQLLKEADVATAEEIIELYELEGSNEPA